MINHKTNIIKRVSYIVIALFTIVLLWLTLFNETFRGLLESDDYIILSIVFIIVILPFYITISFTSDLIELYVHKEDKPFFKHLLEHTLEPILLLLIFTIVAYLIILFEFNNYLLRLVISITISLIYMLIKKVITSK